VRRCLPAIIACVLLCSRPLDAQRPAGEIQLHVQDPSGAPVPASGALRSLDSGVEQTFDTGPQGAHTFPHVAYGRYRLTASAPGFAAQSVILEVSSSAAVQQTLTLALKPQTASVEVVATTPLAGVGVTPDQIPAPVQVATHRELEESGAVNLADFMNKRLNGVHLNEIQGNPYQPDLNYRGYTASPLLGTPQGVSIYMDGVRLNQPFADVVSWDLIPQIAIHEAALMPGSNPLFGLNTLGGSVSLESNSGHTRPGAAITVSGGSGTARRTCFSRTAGASIRLRTCASSSAGGAGSGPTPAFR
jgi:hypothetical protein